MRSAAVDISVRNEKIDIRNIVYDRLFIVKKLRCIRIMDANIRYNLENNADRLRFIAISFYSSRSASAGWIFMD